MLERLKPMSRQAPRNLRSSQGLPVEGADTWQRRAPRSGPATLSQECASGSFVISIYAADSFSYVPQELFGLASWYRVHHLMKLSFNDAPYGVGLTIVFAANVTAAIRASNLPSTLAPLAT